jgi:hypothetical protein
LPGADRALDDIRAAVEALRQRSDVAAGPILIGGVSRGGVLAIAYAGMHPEQVLGVLNFVGGWMGEGCSTAGESTARCFNAGENLAVRPYGVSTTAFTRSNIAVLISTSSKKAGGNGEFIEFAVPDGIGHGLVGYPNLWSRAVEKYLIAIGAPRAQ